MRFSLDLPSPASKVQIALEDEQGRTVRNFELGAQNAGMLDISWSGLDNGGERLPAGRYRIRAFASQAGSAEAVLAFQANRLRALSLPLVW